MARILVVDDDEKLREMICNMLEIEGYQVLRAENGLEAVRHYRKEPADLVILDIILPDQDGIETLRQLNNEFTDVKVIAISGGGTLDPDPSTYLLVADRLGAMRTFTKPIDLDELLDAVRDSLGLAQKYRLSEKDFGKAAGSEARRRTSVRRTRPSD